MWAFLIGAVGPLAIQILITLGFTAVTFTGMTAVMNSLVSQAQSSWSALPAAVLALASLAGVQNCLGLIFGAYVARVTLWGAASASKLIIKGTS